MIGVQQSFTELRRHISWDRKALGSIGEGWVAIALQNAGYAVRTDHVRGYGDLTAVTQLGEMLFIEVKTARRGKDGKYRFTLHKEGCTDHRNTDFVVLCCALKAGDIVPFVIPTPVLMDKSHAVITSFPTTYGGWLAQYRQPSTHLVLRNIERTGIPL